MIKFKKILFIVIIGQVLFLCGVSFNMAQAQGEPYVPLVEIPNINSYEKQQSSDGLSAYLGNMYTFGVAIATLLAVIMIMWGGIEYMSTDSMGGKEGGKEKISNALFGLLLALGSYLILRTINQELLSTKLNIGTVRPETVTVDPAAVERQLQEIAMGPSWLYPAGIYGDLSSFSPNNLNFNEPPPGTATEFFTIDTFNQAVDTDGSGIPPYLDRTRQSQTSYKNPATGEYLNANTDSYFVVPLSSNIPLGTKVKAYDRTTNRTVYGIVGDRGPAFGEMSLAAAKALGISDGTSDSAEQHDVVLTFYK